MDFDPLDDRYMTLPQLVRYSGLSPTTLRRYITQTDNPLPAHYIQHGDGVRNGKLLISKRAFDQWVEQFPPLRAHTRVETRKMRERRWEQKLNK